MRWWPLLVVLGGCRLDASALGGMGATGTTDATAATVASGQSDTRGALDSSSGTGQVDSGASSSSTSGSTSTTAGHGTTAGSSTGDAPADPCSPAPELAACYDFADVGRGTLEDRSDNGNHGSASGVGVVTGPFGDAAAVGEDSKIAVPDSVSLDIDGPITFEAWILVDALPDGERMGVLDREGQYSLMIYQDGQYRCSLYPGELYAGSVILDTWTHVACVYDGVAVRLYVNGSELAMIAASGPLLTNDTEDMSIADTSPDFEEPLRGAIGGVRVWSRALEPAELCEAAGPACEG